MKITSFNPQIFTKNADPIVDLFEGLGFEKRHIKEQISLNNATDVRMKDKNGFHVDVSATGFIIAVSQHTKDSD